MVTVAIVAAVAIPAVQAARKNAAEDDAVGMLRTIVTVQEQYKTRFATYALDLFDLSKMNHGSLKSKKPKQGETTTESEYDLKEFDEIYAANANEWTLQLTPAVPGVTADRSFFADNTGVIRAHSTGPAGPFSRPID